MVSACSQIGSQHSLFHSTGPRFPREMNCQGGVLQILEFVSQCIKEPWEMISLCDFHTQVLGCSHKGDRWAVKMGLAAVCPGGRKREMFIKHSAATYTSSQTVVVQLCSAYHVWRKKVNKWHNDFGERARERWTPVLRWHFNESKRQRGMEGGAGERSSCLCKRKTTCKFHRLFVCSPTTLVFMISIR